MKFVTFNIRCDYEQDGIQNFSNRKPLIEQKIKEESPDIICFQEVLPHVAEWLKKSLSDYYVIGCGRDTKYRNEQATIAFKKDSYNLMSMDTIWLSETPQIPGSRYKDQSECPRTCTIITLEELRSRQVFRVCNTHLDHIGSGARKEGMECILNYIGKMDSFLKPLVIITGDFNALPKDKEIKAMMERPEYTDLTKEIAGTFHDYGKIAVPDKIDYIFAEKPLKGRNAKVWDDCKDSIYLSDHYPISVEIYMD